ARISQFAKHNVLRIDAVGDPQLEKACARAGNLGGRKKRTGTKQRILPADPQPPPADLAVGDALEAATQDRPERAKDLRDIVEPDASYEVNVLRRLHDSTSCSVDVISDGRGAEYLRSLGRIPEVFVALDYLC